jgi:hypothetical protein
VDTSGFPAGAVVAAVVVVVVVQVSLLWLYRAELLSYEGTSLSK